MRPVPTDLTTRLGSVVLSAPVMTASGTAGHGAELAAYGDLAALGAVVTKSVAATSWPGNPAPRLVEVGAGMLNGVGLQGPGVEAWLAEDLPALRAAGARVVVSLWGRRLEEFAEAASLLARGLAASGAEAAVAAIEVNVSCPNLEDGEAPFAHSPAATAAAISAADCGLARWAKLSPGIPHLVEVAVAAIGAGAEALTLVNTLPGLAIDVEARRRLPAAGGGLSGTALHPVAVRAVWDCHAALPTVPLVGAGGVVDATSAVELFMAGASAVQVGSATFADPKAPWRVLAGLVRWCKRHQVASVAELVGAAHEEPAGSAPAPRSP